MCVITDCSQTLYEFRASNPKALNILESSGIFETHALQTNYRSNQEILDFANASLADIEANQYANLRLHSNDIASMPKKATFMHKVCLEYRQLGKQSALLDAIKGSLASESVHEWIRDCFLKNEKIAILAYSRREIDAVKETLEKLYPNKKISSLVPKRQFNSTVFSRYIRKRIHNLAYMPSNDILTNIEKDIMNNLATLTYINKYKPEETYKAVNAMLESFRKMYGAAIAQDGLMELQGIISKEQLLANIKDHMLRFEIQNNSIRQSLLSKDNEENKNDMSGDFILSTIHSAKGLEFPNVIVIHKNRNAMPEDMKRMYYVAFTRACQKEYVLSYDTTDTPRVCYDYIHIVDSLPGDLSDSMVDKLPITDTMIEQAKKQAAQDAQTA